MIMHDNITVIYFLKFMLIFGFGINKNSKYVMLLFIVNIIDKVFVFIDVYMYICV